MSESADFLSGILKSFDTSEKILVVNLGSSSIKVTLFLSDGKRVLDADLAEKEGGASLAISYLEGKQSFASAYDPAALLDLFAKSFKGITGIGHRYVHGGAKYILTTVVNDDVLEDLKDLNDFAPLHNPICLNGVLKCIELFGKSVPQALVFDTAFHSTIPEAAANYAIPYSLAKKYGVKRYGFHGISHAFCFNAYRKTNPSEIGKVITVHLGHGCSMTAIKDGVSIDTSMGFTPLEGLMMSTRSGDLDPGLFEFLCVQEKKSASEILELLNNRSGLLGVSEISDDMEKVLSEIEVNKNACLAVDMFCYRIVKYLGAYINILGGVDAIIFSGGIGENAFLIRERVLEKLEWLGVKMDKGINGQIIGPSPGSIHKISSPDSSIGLFVIGTDENKYIFQEVCLALKKTGPA